MEILLCHLVGDYVLQNHIMATRKTSSWLWATIHSVFYGLPFLLLVSSWEQWAVIVGTHIIIDRFRIAAWWVDFWGTGKAGWLPTQIVRLFVPVEDLDEVLPKNAPDWLGVWLLILVDNTLHMSINFAVLRWM